MALYELTQNDINDLRALISSPTLAIQANQAMRVFALQKQLSDMRPSDRVEQLAKLVENLETQIREALRARDAAQLEVGITKRDLDKSQTITAALRDRLEEERIDVAKFISTIDVDL